MATLYVNNSASSHCADEPGAGSSTMPFCTIPAALGVVQPGQTVMIEPGFYAPFVLSVSGTAAAPITITNPTGTAFSGGLVAIQSTVTSPAITVSGASHVNVDGLALQAITANSALVVTGSDHVALDQDTIVTRTASNAPTVDITGDSSAVSISRNEVSGSTSAPMLDVHGGSTGAVVTTTMLTNVGGPALVADAAPNTAFTSNSIIDACGFGIELTDGVSGASVQNNVVYKVSGTPALPKCATPVSAAVGLLVDSASATGNTVDYNALNSSNYTEYSWSGTTYTKSAALYAATGQGAHNTDNPLVPAPETASGTASALIDSANADAPGELTTDLNGLPRVDDPAVADTGAGSHTYYDRGATEAQPTGVRSQTIHQTSENAPVGATITFSANAQDPWNAALTCTFNFGDGVSDTVAASAANYGEMCTTSHTYTTVGTYSPTLTTTAYGSALTTNAAPVYIAKPIRLTPLFSVYPSGTTAVTTNQAASSSWDITDYKVDFGDGTSEDNGTCCPYFHAYAKPGTYVLTLTVTDAGGETATASQTFTTAGQYYSALAPVRVLDTRNGTGVPTAGKVAAGGTVRLKLAGIGSIPANGLAAIALNLTVTAPDSGGYITAFPEGGQQPATSNVNFTAGQTVANFVIVQVGTDGYIDLKNASGGSAHLIADVAGYYGTTATDGFQPTAPTRVLDTRATHTTVPANGTTRLDLSAYTGISAAALNLTVTNPTGGGYITAFPDGGTRPVASNVDFAAHQTIPNEVMVKVGADGYVDFTNSSSGSVDLVVDLTGYFTPGAGLPFVPVVPTRYLDTRKGIGASAGAVKPGDTVNVVIDNRLATPIVSAIAANVTVTAPTGGGYITAYPNDATTRPTASVINFQPGQTVPNGTTVAVGAAGPVSIPTGGIDLYNGSNGSTDLILDVFGFYNPVSTP